MMVKLKFPDYKIEHHLREKTINAVTDTLEKIAFIEIIPSKLMSPYDESLERLKAEILINAPFSGKLRLVLSRTLAKQLVLNTYPTEKIELREGRFIFEDTNQINIPDDILDDVLGEIVNIVAGKLMRGLIPEDQSYEIGLPEIGADTYLKYTGASLCIEFFAEGHPFWLVLFGDGFINSPLINPNQ
ncbi:MAG: hypothetical protein HOC24_03175 [Deltaproteobacteria bacterium]|jgi:hypothetical protein|nr:hypothetical protein [Deltaproteobacteria bacterium]